MRAVKQASQCDRILAFLSDGQPHPMLEIHDAVGFCRLNSRVAELRTRGHDIVCDPAGGQYVYQLLGASSESPLSVPAARQEDPVGHDEDGRGDSEDALFDAGAYAA